MTESKVQDMGSGSQKIFLHTCCAPCSVKCMDVLQSSGFQVTAFWYNPNIHPFTEYRSRRDALIEYCKSENMDVVTKDEYGLRRFISDVYPRFDQSRCEICYRNRIEQTAIYASENDFDVFCTTLLISPYQKHDLIRKICLEMSEKYSIKFHYVDFRPYFREGQRIARGKGLYMQKYCGCIFSEEERYTRVI